MPDLTTSFAALGNSTRFAIVERLIQEGELAAGELQDVEEISPPALSRHFKVLLEAGIISQRVDKKRRMYSVCPEAVKAINDWSMIYRQFWDGSFDRLTSALKREVR
ncbi:MAG: metalloregulator ArsR/SmtB family transcription factor [Paracoccaceae bacterium]